MNAAGVAPVGTTTGEVSTRSTGALAAGALSVLLSVAVVLMHQANGDVPFRDDYLPYSLTVAAGAALYSSLGAVIVWRHCRHPIGMLLLAIGLAAVTTAAAGEYALLGAGSGALLPGASWGWWVNSFLWLPGYAIRGTLLLVIFPNGRPFSKAWWPVAVAAALLIVAETTWIAITPFDRDLPVQLAGLSHPLGFDGEPRGFEEVFAQVALAYFVVTMACIAALVYRLVRSPPVDRQRLGWFALGSALWVAASILDSVHHYSERWVWAELIFIALPALGATVGIVAYDLYDIRRVVHRGAVLAVFAAVAAGTYGTVVVLGEYWFGRSRNDPWSSVLAAAFVAAAAVPLLRWADRSAQRLLFGEAADPLDVLSRVSTELLAAEDPPSALARSAHSIGRSLRIPYVKIDADELDLVQVGSPTTDLEELPLVDHGLRVGTLTLGRRAVGEAFRPHERRLLDDLAARIAATVTAMRLSQDLATNRERLVLAREEERRRIRHDLHDGLGPQLAGIGLQLDLGRELLDGSPGQVAPLLTRAKDELDAAIIGIRALVDGLRPPALDELGLVGAIRQQVSALDASVTDGLSVTVHCDGLIEALPAAVEVAAYRIATEAASNAARHSGATTCAITIRGGDTLDLVIEDDGSGIDHTAARGVGLGSMRQRAEELGGELTLESRPPSGTRVIARLPLP